MPDLKLFVMMTRGDKIAFGVIALLLALAIVFREELGGFFSGEEKQDERKEKKGGKDKDKDKDKENGRIVPMENNGLWDYTVLYA